jgi:poly(beta-D-mannuronate) lyase
VVKLATESRYVKGDEAHAKVDKDAQQRYKEEIKPVREYAKEVVKLANDYVEKGDATAATCALEWLHSWAEANALSQLPTLQAKLGQGQTVSSLALAYLQIRDVGTLSEAKKQDVENWLARMSENMVELMESRSDKDSGQGNHRYWNGLGVAASGIAAGRENLLNWGLDSARLGLSQVTEEGALPIEMGRGKRARDYHIFAVTPLVMLAEIGAVNNQDIYGAYDGALHRVIDRIMVGIDDPSFYEERSGQTQVDFPTDDKTVPDYRMAWLEPYQRRFPDPRQQELLDQWDNIYFTSLGGDVTMLFDAES